MTTTQKKDLLKEAFDKLAQYDEGMPERNEHDVSCD